jgi:putative FmdB family regulatory protein
MPIYEYTCEECELTFEELVRNGVPVACPTCGSGHVRRLLSRFAVHSSSPDKGGRGAKNCSTCAGSSCATCH